MILDNQRSTIDKVAQHLNISHGSAHEIVKNQFGFHKVSARLVPEKLTIWVQTVETLQPLNFEMLEHHPYSPDLALSEFHLFGPLKDTLRGRHFASDEQVKVVHVLLNTQPKFFCF